MAQEKESYFRKYEEPVILRCSAVNHTLFHIKYPKIQGFFTWDELGCLARAIGFPIDLFESNLAPEISTEENGMNIQEAYRMLDNRLLERALHRTQNLHTAEWNMNVVRKSLHLLNYKAIQFQELYNIRIAYQAFEQFDMMGMLLNQHVILNTLKMCNRNIAPMKLANRIKHMKDNFEESGRIQLHEFLDLVLWCQKYEDFSLDKIEYSEGKDETDMFKLVNFEKLLSHHDQRLAVKLNDEYLKEEWDFGMEKFSSKKMFKEPPVICADERIQQARDNKAAYKDLKNEVVKSQKMVYKARAGYVRERPITAPDLSKYLKQDTGLKEEGISADKVYDAVQLKIRRASRVTEPPLSVRSMSAQSEDGRISVTVKHSGAPRVISDQDQEEAQKKIDELTFHIETLGSKCRINKEMLLNYYVPGYKDHSDEKSADEQPVAVGGKAGHGKTSQSKPSKEEVINNLAYPKPLLPPSHARICDARFRGWSDVKSRKGSHYILTEPSFENSYKGRLNKKMVKESSSIVKNIHGDVLYRYTKKNEVTDLKPNKKPRRPFTAPPAVDTTEMDVQGELTDVSPSDSNKTVDTGYGSGEDKSESSENISNTNFGMRPLVAWKSENNLFDDKIFAVTRPDDRKEAHKKNFFQKDKELKRTDSSHKGGNLQLFENNETLKKQKEIISVDDMPIPQMEHAKPKVVCVGGIGTISLLESITEAKSLEDLYDTKHHDDTDGAGSYHDGEEDIESDTSIDSGNEADEMTDHHRLPYNDIDVIKFKKKQKVRKAIHKQFFGNYHVNEILAKEKERRIKKRNRNNNSLNQKSKTLSRKYEKRSKKLTDKKLVESKSISCQNKNIDELHSTDKENCASKFRENIQRTDNPGNIRNSEILRSKTSLGKLSDLKEDDQLFEKCDIRPRTTSTCSGKYERLLKRVNGQISNELTVRLLTPR